MEQTNFEKLKQLIREQYEELGKNCELTADDIGVHPDDRMDLVDLSNGERERNARLMHFSRVTDTKEELRAALGRIDSGLYGICQVCHEPIGLPRLSALPATTLCIDCKIFQRTNGS